MHHREIPISKGILSDDGYRRIFLKEVGRHCFLSMDSLQDGSWLRQETRLSKSQLLSLWPSIQTLPLVFSRKSGILDGLHYTIDSYREHLDGLHIATFQFSHSREAFQWSVPAHLGPEITFDRRFTHTWLLKDPSPIQQLPLDLATDKKNFVVGAIPYLRVLGEVEIVTVHTRKKSLTIFPKGQPETHLHAREVARLEAIEEAGVEGEFKGHPILVPFKDFSPQHWILFPMEVKNIMSEWKEKGIRNRSLVSLSKALHHPQFIRLDPALRYLATSLGLVT